MDIEIGKKYGKLTVIGTGTPYGRRNGAFYECLCDCGQYAFRKPSRLLRNKDGCQDCREKNFQVHPGARFGRLLVLGNGNRVREGGRRNHHIYLARCQCDCGTIIEIKKKYLTQDITKSCGCLRKDWGKIISPRLSRLLKQAWAEVKDIA